MYLPGLNLRARVAEVTGASGVSDHSPMYSLTGSMTDRILQSRSEKTNKKDFSSFQK